MTALDLIVYSHLAGCLVGCLSLIYRIPVERPSNDVRH